MERFDEGKARVYSQRQLMEIFLVLLLGKFSEMERSPLSSEFWLNKKSCVWADDAIQSLAYHKNFEDARENPLARDFF
ncbi:MAG: hypothetical protein F6K22_27740 [Okeania sp. SIO2F4]|uniref:hypothetical protein n=1 Tax=Okeania sp. SIO2F4 TaxID=2607790 RepID=UPI00142A8CE4|nr:hypothetical protein [Okeania sp. SIO2F4]NES06272.1 hypothetical protein [Okeania sp. SIO2F4]